jgi:hypothetical protein
MDTDFFGTFVDKCAFRHCYFDISNDVPEDNHIIHAGGIFGDCFFGAYQDRSQIAEFDLMALGTLTKDAFLPDLYGFGRVPEFFHDKDAGKQFEDFVGMFAFASMLRKFHVVLRVTNGGQEAAQTMLNAHFSGAMAYALDELAQLKNVHEQFAKTNLLCTLVDNGVQRWHLG